MATQKSFIIKIFDQDGVSFLKNIPQGPGGLKNIPSFRSRINGGFAECVLDLDLPWDDFDEGVSISFMNIVEIWCQDAANPLGRRIYKGFISQYAPYFDAQSEGVKVTLLGLVALLSRSYYKSGTDFTVSHTSVDPQAIGEAIIDHFNTVFGGNLITYTHGTSTQAVGTNVSYDFTDQRWIEAITTDQQLAGANWWWSLDRDGVFNLQAKLTSATHKFTVGTDINSLTAPKNSEKVINDVQVRYASSGVYDATDGTSQTTFGTGSPATGKFSEIITDTSIADSTTAEQRGNKEINDFKAALNSAVIVVNMNYDIESVQVGQTCTIANVNIASTFFDNVLQIVALTYTGDTIEIEVEQIVNDIGMSLSSFVNTQGTTSSGGTGGGGTTATFVDRETPSGSVDSNNVTFTLGSTPVVGSEHVFLDGILQIEGTDYTISGSIVTFTFPPSTGSALRVSYRTSSGTFNFADRETPSGTVNGSNVTFTLAHTPTTGSEYVWMDGVLQSSGTDYTISSGTITFVSAPLTGAVLVVSYRF